MRSTLLWLTATTAVTTVLAHTPIDGTAHQKMARAMKKRGGWHLVNKFTGSNFADGFDFVSGPADNGGQANYLSQDAATGSGLFYTNGDGAAVLGVDTTGYVDYLRNAVKLTSKAQYHNFLMIADVASMPAVCGVWPAIWSTGNNWPFEGEIDLIEYVSEQTVNSFSVHTGPGCFMGGDGYKSKLMLDSAEAYVCDALSTSSQGCGARSTESNTAGSGFNANGGGVFAMLQGDNGVFMWQWPAGQVPGDITAGYPDSNSWGTPDFMAASTSCPASNFGPQTIVINTNLCGTWAEGVWNADNSYAGQAGSCADRTGFGSCADYVKSQGGAFGAANWVINSISIYQ